MQQLIDNFNLSQKVCYNNLSMALNLLAEKLDDGFDLILPKSNTHTFISIALKLATNFHLLNPELILIHESTNLDYLIVNGFSYTTRENVLIPYGSFSNIQPEIFKE